MNRACIRTDKVGFLRVEQSGDVKNPAEKHDWAYAEIRARRVKSDERDETQIEIELINTYPSGKSRSMLGCQILEPDQARRLALAICPELGRQVMTPDTPPASEADRPEGPRHWGLEYHATVEPKPLAIWRLPRQAGDKALALDTRQSYADAMDFVAEHNALRDLAAKRMEPKS